jgi:hypothetical protein
VGKKQNNPFQLFFNGFLKVDFQGSRVTSDGGFILVRALDQRLGFGEFIQQHMKDSGRGKALPRQGRYRQLTGVATRAAFTKPLATGEG